jgi:hypothetical protein
MYTGSPPVELLELPPEPELELVLPPAPELELAWEPELELVLVVVVPTEPPQPGAWTRAAARANRTSTNRA